MKRMDVYKTIHLIILVLVTAFVLVFLFRDPEIFHQAANDRSMTLLLVVLWVVLGLSFIFVFVDFSEIRALKKNYKELDLALRADPVSGIANRFSCDIIIEKYLDKPLPQNLACIMFDITNIQKINNLYGHHAGNNMIKDFSDILRVVSENTCFVGRNGGNKFLAIFENADDDSLKTFLDLLKLKVRVYNYSQTTTPIEYSYGLAFHEAEEVKTITDLIALSNRRIQK